ncbi:MAG: Ig-like domain-containing protein [Bacteroidota bacterium]
MKKQIINIFSSSSYPHIRIWVYLLICTLIYSCAQVVAPGGGIKDITPPKVVKYIPDSASLNFRSKSIVVFFDEFIQLKDLNSQLIISPPLENSPDIKVKNKTLTIDFDKDESLKPNTTYSISFGNALQDIHENNPIDNFKYIFSTGSFIDSVVVKGKIESAFDHKADKGVLVMLYTDFSDSVIYKKKPDYFAKTKEDGTFQINNIRANKYKLLVLKDANANYKYDSENESVGFIDALVDVSEKKNILISVFQEPVKKLFLKKTSYNSFGKIIFIFNKPADSIRIQPLNQIFNDKDIFLDYSKNKDTLNYWFRKDDKDSIILQVKNGYRIIDTVEFKIIKKEDALKGRRSPLKLVVVNSPAGNQNVDLNSEFKIVFNNPLEILKGQNEKLNFIEDTISYKSIKPLTFHYSYSDRNELQIGYWGCDEVIEDANNPGTMIVSPCFISPPKLKENTNYHLFIPPGTFTDIFGLQNDSIKIDFKTREEKFYGTLKLRLDIPVTAGNYIVQLLDEKESIVRVSNINKPETLFYEYLYPKKYKLKIIFDDNANYKWDTGNLLQKLQPEKVIYNAEPVNTRPNWDLELEWKVTP